MRAYRLSTKKLGDSNVAAASELRTMGARNNRPPQTWQNGSDSEHLIRSKTRRSSENGRYTATVLSLSNKDSLAFLTRILGSHPRLVSCHPGPAARET